MGYGPEYQKIGFDQMQMPGKGPSGLAALLQRPGLRDALMAAGAALLQQKDQPGTFGGALGRALPVGMQAYQQGQQQDKIQQLLANAPPEMRQLLMSLPKEAQGPALFQMMMPKAPAAPVAVGANERLVDPGSGREIVSAAPPAPSEPPADIQSFREFLKMKPEDQDAYRQWLAAKNPPGATVNVNAGGPSAAQSAIGEAVKGTITGAGPAADALTTVGNIDRIIEITEDPKFKDVSGPLFGGSFGELSARFADDPKARELLAEFNAIGGKMTMAQLQAFTGPKTDFEFQQARRLALNDTKMTPEEIRAGLRVHRRVAIEQAQRWSKSMLDLDPKRLQFDPRDVGAQLDLAQQIQQKYGAPAKGADLADPLGIRR